MTNPVRPTLLERLGRRKKLCLIPAGILAAVTVHHLYAIFGDATPIPEPLGSIAVAWLILATILLAGNARSVWLRDETAKMVADLVAGQDRTRREVAAISVLVVNLAPARPQANPRLRFTRTQPEPARDDPIWRQNTAQYGTIQGHVYGTAAAVEQGGGPELDRWDQVVRDYNASPREDTGDVTPPELRSS